MAVAWIMESMHVLVSLELAPPLPTARQRLYTNQTERRRLGEVAIMSVLAET
jgi:hypothetical protein